MKVSYLTKFKNSNSNPTVFWRSILLVFSGGLLLIMIGQTIFLSINLNSRITPGADFADKILVEEKEDQKINKLLLELQNRPIRFADALATTTVLLDPSR